MLFDLSFPIAFLYAPQPHPLRGEGHGYNSLQYRNDELKFTLLSAPETQEADLPAHQLIGEVQRQEDSIEDNLWIR